MVTTGNKILINRAPVLTLWASVVAERLGFKHNEALLLGKALAGLNTQSKGQRLGIFKPTPKELKKVREHERGEEFRPLALLLASGVGMFEGRNVGMCSGGKQKG